MKYRTLGRTGLEVSALGLGALEVGRPWGLRVGTPEGQPPAEEEAGALLNLALDLGINFIDTAAAYWASEERIGRHISSRRNEFVLASKWGEWCDASGSVYDYSPEAFWKFLESSLHKLNTDRIDLYQIHSGSEELVREGEALAEMQKARDQGKIRFIGLSCDARAAEAAIESGAFDTIQISYNILDRHMEDRVLPMAEAADVGVIVKDPLAAGRLTQKYELLGEDQEQLKLTIQRLAGLAGMWGMRLPELALQFVLANPAVSTAIAGTRSQVHLEENTASVDASPLSPDQLEQVRSAT